MDYSPATDRVRVLVVDDNRDAADSCATLLDLSGFEARSVYSGSDALWVANTFPPDVVLLDLRMPGMDGFDLAHQFRQQSTGKRPFLVAVTGCATQDEHRRSAEAGIDLHLDKPVEPAVLMGVLRRFARVLNPA
jgi:CheY-like chemotaxis protein